MSDDYTAGTPAPASNNYITVLTGNTSVNKNVRVTKEGEVKKDSRGVGAYALAETVYVGSVQDMEAVLREIAADPNKCIAQGFFPGTEPVGEEYYGEEFVVMSKDAISEATKRKYTDGWETVNGRRTIARLKVNMSPSNWIQLDRDFAAGLPPELAELSDEDWLARIDAFCPGIAAAGYVRAASTSGRVCLDGRPLDSSGCRYWMQITDPTDYSSFGQRMKLSAAANGCGFMKQMKGNRGTLWAIFDPTVFSWERVSYDGKPSISTRGASRGRLTLREPDIQVVEGATLNTHACEPLTEAEAARVKDTYHVVAKKGGDGSLKSFAEGYLELDTPINTEAGVFTPRQFADSEHKKLRCESTFRESDSQNAFITQDSAGHPRLYDNGTHTWYELSAEGKALRLLEANQALFDHMNPPVDVEPVHRFRSLNASDLPDCQWTAGTAQTPPAPRMTQLATDDNILWVLKNMGVTLRTNMMTHQDEYACAEYAGTEGQLRISVLSEMLRLGINNDHRFEAVSEAYAMEQAYHPGEQWVKATPWDGKDHIAALAATVTTDTPLWGVYLRKWLIQGAAAIHNWRDGPGQYPHCLVLSGGHGMGKSHWFKNLLPADMFKGEASLHLNSGGDGKDHRLAALRCMVTELAELETTLGKSDVGALKAFLSTEVDEIRRPYGVGARLMARTTIFCGSVNLDEFLIDKTGNRRFWPVSVDAIAWVHDVDFQQVWAQAMALMLSGEGFMLSKAEGVQHDQISADHLSQSPVEEAFYNHFDEALMATPQEDWRIATMTDIFALIGYTGSCTHPVTKRELNQAVTGYFGKGRRLQSFRKVRRVPVSAGDRHMTVEGRGNITHLRSVPVPEA